jgi:hypothetical protein
MPIAFPPEASRPLAVGLLEDIADVAQSLTAIILDSVQVVGMDKFDKKVGHVIDGIFVPELEFAHAALSQLVENQPDWMIIRNGAPQSANHWKPLVSIDVSKERVLHAYRCSRWWARR